MRGYRVIALAGRELARTWTYARLQRAQRDQLECDLTFLGMLVMENRLKPQTSAVIDTLRHARLRTLMITGTAR